MKKNHIMIAVSFVILAFVILFSNPIKIIEVLINANPIFILAAFGVALLNILLRVAKWSVLVGVPTRRLIDVQMLGLTISNFTPGKIADPAKSLILKAKNNIPVSESLISIIWERVNDVTVMIILSLIGLQFIALDVQTSILSMFGIGIFVALIAVMMIILFYQKLGRKIFFFLKRFPIMNKLSDDFIDNFYSTSIGKKKIIISFIITLVAWVLEGVVMLFVLMSLGLGANFVLLAGMISLSVLIGVASSLPGGIGSTEFVMILLLGVIGIGAEAAAIVLVYRFLTFWFGALLGGVSMVHLSRKGVKI